MHEDIQEAIKSYEDMGFIIKRGRLHENGLLNAHIKFPNRSSFELMSIQGEPKDEIALTYKWLLNEGIEGAYLALTGIGLRDIQTTLHQLNIDFQVSSGKLWTYVTFPASSELAHLFFIIYHQEFPPSAEFTQHKNGCDAISRVSIEGSDELISLLQKFELPQRRSNLITHFQSKTGLIEVISTKPNTSRPKIRKIVFENSITKEVSIREFN